MGEVSPRCNIGADSPIKKPPVNQRFIFNKHKDLILVKEAFWHKHIETTLRYSRKTKEEIANALEDTELNIYK
ncbi:hypothetical protein COS91_04870 [Candidatus Desantisbacteria bacterium CG07_land_8_20_14_0_80_39_15]|uniref:Uncharacterized protein n=1 Tax=Candidatus Desantisbacteria bacterium CG07_land_8_20_14_0_80_39_15 TaxID=1974549 RepID=A0A2M6ZG43_9BACT|nr:MAG: hypothetical protein COS91_04870 [Candidatus Desantisbacteria bacterium CG07_land_8_20_14_0_80_39_15]